MGFVVVFCGAKTTKPKNGEEEEWNEKEEERQVKVCIYFLEKHVWAILAYSKSPYLQICRDVWNLQIDAVRSEQVHSMYKVLAIASLTLCRL